MSEPDATRHSGAVDSDKIQTVGQLKVWLKGFADHHSVFGAIEGQPLSGHVLCRHAQGRVIIEVPRLEQG